MRHAHGRQAEQVQPADAALVNLATSIWWISEHWPAGWGNAGAGFIALAVLPGADPLGLSERGRMYASEALLGLLFMHIRLTMPWLFHGFFTRYWPIIVWFRAFLGVGLSEFFRCQRHDVPAEPLERTGAFLPVLPALGYWMVHSNVDYSAVLLLVGILYGTLFLTRS